MAHTGIEGGMMRSVRHLLSIGLIALLWAPAAQAGATLNVLACEPEWAALVQAIGKEHVEVKSATTAFQNPHHIQARPSLIARARNADLVVCTGAELEVGWLPLLLRQSGNARIQRDKPGYFMASEQVELIEQLEKVDRSMGDIHAGGNPHVHLDPYRLLQIARQLGERMKQIDPVNARDYQANLESFASQWQTAIERWETKARPLKDIKVVVQHRSWSYLFTWLEMEVVADLEPKPGLPPTSGHLAGLLDVIQAEQPRFIVLTTYQSDRGASWLSRRTQLPVITLPYTVGGHEQATDLFGLYETTLDMLLKAIE
ncbi:metal ABC transporter substrate-binding protein [Thiohalophilus sp.]|uniref:metal ABC transporter substrate-binding protein n=1 Tax=Thiohalophilus sp. TaxID=3028392 RepID=UPI0039764EFF